MAGAMIVHNTGFTGGDASAQSVVRAAGFRAWEEPKADHVTADTFGDYLDDEVSSRMAAYTQPTGFLAATFPATVASTTNITAGTISTVTNLTNAPTAGDLTTAMKASVNAEVLDVLNVDTFAELVGDPGASPTVVKALMLLYMALRNKADVTANAKEIHNSAGTVILTKTLSDDGTTYSESKVA